MPQNLLHLYRLAGSFHLTGASNDGHLELHLAALTAHPPGDLVSALADLEYPTPQSRAVASFSLLRLRPEQLQIGLRVDGLGSGSLIWRPIAESFLCQTDLVWSFSTVLRTGLGDLAREWIQAVLTASFPTTRTQGFEWVSRPIEDGQMRIIDLGLQPKSANLAGGVGGG